MCCNNECLEKISAACILPIEGIQGDNLAAQMLLLYTNISNLQNQSITVNIGGLYNPCDPYQYNYTVTQPTIDTILISFDWTAFNTPISYVANVTIFSDGAVYGIYNTNNITLPASLLGSTIHINFSENTDSGIHNYTTMFQLNLPLNTVITQSLTCINSQIVTLPVQMIIQLIIDRLVNMGA